MSEQRPIPPREPMPKSFKPAWIYIGLMISVWFIMGLIAVIVALIVK